MLNPPRPLSVVAALAALLLSACEAVAPSHDLTPPSLTPASSSAMGKLLLKGVATVPPARKGAKDGKCGDAIRVAHRETPKDNLCDVGDASAFTGTGPWTWICSDDKGGLAVSCKALSLNPADDKAGEKAAVVAPPASNDKPSLCGPAAELAPSEAPDTHLCRAGKASSVTGDGPWLWTCTDASGKMAECSTLTALGNLRAVAETEDAKAKETPSSDVNTASSSSSSSPLVPPAPAVKPSPKVPTCGAAAGQGVLEMPKEKLCEMGRPSKVGKLVRGAWHWTCWLGKKEKVACLAPKREEAVCGTATKGSFKESPAKNLCRTGVAGDVKREDGSWKWSCAGLNNGADAACVAAVKLPVVSGICGDAAKKAFTAPPSDALCAVGKAGSVTGDGPWAWACAGERGGKTATCLAQKALAPPSSEAKAEIEAPVVATKASGVAESVNGLCGPANGATYTAAPKEGFCVTGNATSVAGNGPWTWSCLGVNDGMTVSCAALAQPTPPVAGECGEANNRPTLSAPSTALCDAGIAGTVNGTGPWTWTCSGTNGGAPEVCLAPLAGEGASSAPLPETVAAPSAMAPSAGGAKLVTPHLPEGTLLPFNETTLQNGLAHAMDGASFTVDSDLSRIFYEPGQEGVDEDGGEILDRLAAAMAAHSNAHITVTAYASAAKSTAREAHRLSLRRALAVRDYLVDKGVADGQISLRAKGENIPNSGEADRVDITSP